MNELVEKFFRGLGIQLSALHIESQDDDVHIQIETTDSPLIIGMHGKNLEVFQHLLGRMVEKALGHFVHVHLEVNDYVKSKDERLFRFLDNKIAFVMSSGKTLRIPELTSYERKKAHGYISEKHIEGLMTKSEGEGQARALHISYTGTLIAANPAPITSSRGDDLSEDGVGI